MSVLSCATGVTSSFLPFQDPVVDEEALLQLLQTRIDVEISRQTVPSGAVSNSAFVRHPHHLLRLLRRYNHGVELALTGWCDWVRWRHEQKADNITDDNVHAESAARLAVWWGHDKSDRLCCVITGRHLNPAERRRLGGNSQTFQQYLIRVVEDGCLRAMEDSSTSNRSNSSNPIVSTMERDAYNSAENTMTSNDSSSSSNSSSSRGGDDSSNRLSIGPDFCVIYDRRGLEFANIDPMLYKLCRSTVEALRVS